MVHSPLGLQLEHDHGGSRALCVDRFGRDLPLKTDHDGAGDQNIATLKGEALNRRLWSVRSISLIDILHIQNAIKVETVRPRMWGSC